MKYFILALLLISIPAFAKGQIHPLETLKLDRVVDGDTIVASGKKIRLWGFDAPEKGAPLFKLSTALLTAILKDQPLTCRFIDKDKYQRDVMHCYSAGHDIGSEMVLMGMARDFERYSGGYYQHEQDLAKEKKRGIWKPGNDGSGHPS